MFSQTYEIVVIKQCKEGKLMQRGCIKLVIGYFRAGETVRRDVRTAILMVCCAEG